MRTDTPSHSDQRRVLLSATGLRKQYSHRTFLGEEHRVIALAGIDLTIDLGKTTAIVGESGSGKSTLAMCLARLEEPDSGTITYLGRDLLAVRQEELRAVRAEIQLIMQDAAMAMNPRFRLREIVEEPLLVQR